jgi:hypothetical protein
MARPEVTSQKLSATDEDDADEQYLTGPDVLQRYHVSEMWVHRQDVKRRKAEAERRNTDLIFPAPDMVLSGRKRWRLSTLTKWERRVAVASG